MAALAVALGAVPWGGGAARADVLFWSEGFESYDVGQTINSFGTTWSANPNAYVVGPPEAVHTGSRALMVSEAFIGYDATWFDDTPGRPHGGLVHLSWWMNHSQDSTWYVSAWEWNGTKVAEIANAELGSPSSVDVRSTTGWTETLQDVYVSTWSHVSLDIDFAANPDQYRVRVGDAGTWTGWFTLGTSEAVGHWPGGLDPPCR
jgi:hypothetical protein